MKHSIYGWSFGLLALAAVHGQEPEDGKRVCASETPAPQEQLAVRRDVQRMRLANKSGLVPLKKGLVLVWAHVIHHSSSEGKVEKAMIDKQIDVLNECFGPAGFEFKLATIDVTESDEWFNNMSLGSTAEKAAKEKLSKDPDTYLNLYTVRPRNRVFGWATWPWDLEKSPKMDGVVVDYRTLPGGGREDYDLGKTAVHELAHWLGLLHTFDGNSCSGTGDEVADTPQEAEASYEDPGSDRDTCPDHPGKDSTENYMNLVYDRCMKEFTKGQIERMWTFAARYRPSLFPRDELASLDMSTALDASPVVAATIPDAITLAAQLLEDKKLEWGNPKEVSLQNGKFTLKFATPPDEQKKIGMREVIVSEEGSVDLAPRR